MNQPAIAAIATILMIALFVLGQRQRRNGPAGTRKRPRNHVYVIAYRSRRGRPIGPSKIGIAKDPEQRLRTFQTANPRPLVLYRTFPVSRARALEQAVHAHLHAVRMKGEWFALPPERAAMAVNTIMKNPHRTPLSGWGWSRQR